LNITDFHLTQSKQAYDPQDTSAIDKTASTHHISASKNLLGVIS